MCGFGGFGFGGFGFGGFDGFGFGDDFDGFNFNDPGSFSRTSPFGCFSACSGSSSATGDSGSGVRSRSGDFSNFKFFTDITDFTGWRLSFADFNVSDLSSGSGASCNSDARLPGELMQALLPPVPGESTELTETDDRSGSVADTLFLREKRPMVGEVVFVSASEVRTAGARRNRCRRGWIVMCATPFSGEYASGAGVVSLQASSLSSDPAGATRVGTSLATQFATGLRANTLG